MCTLNRVFTFSPICSTLLALPLFRRCRLQKCFISTVVCRANVALLVDVGTHGVMIGANTFLAIVLQSFLTFMIVDIRAPIQIGLGEQVRAFLKNAFSHPRNPPVLHLRGYHGCYWSAIRVVGCKNTNVRCWRLCYLLELAVPAAKAIM